MKVMAEGTASEPIRVVALMEARNVTGPAKNLIEFARRAREVTPGLRPIEFSIVTYSRGEGETPFMAAIHKAGLPLEVIPERGRFDRSAMTRLARIVDAKRPDVLQSHNTKSALFVRLSGLHRRYPWVAFQHGYTRTNLMDRVYSQADRWSFRRARYVVTVCEPFADAVAALGISRDRIRVQHNSVRAFVRPDDSVVAQVRSSHGADGKILVITVGRLSSEKGHADLVAALASVRDLPLKLVIVGDGPERPALEVKAGALGVRDMISFAGHQHDVAPYYAAADIMALPSHSEGSPNVLLEAMSAGVASIATRVGGVPEIATGGVNALIVPAREPLEFGKALRRLALDADLRSRLAAAGLEHIRNFTPEQYHRSMVAFYERVVAEARQSNVT
jgi:glycosyltransferase involved in cell wall biosynthesis